MASISIRLSVLVVFLAPCIVYLARRVRVLSLAYFNAPGRMPSYAHYTSSDIKFTEKIRNCEDVVLVESYGLALLACDPGRETWNTGLFVEEAPPENAELWVYKYTDPSLSDAQSLLRIKIVGLDTELRTVGFDFHEPSATLFVTNHGREGPRIEQFSLEPGDSNSNTQAHALASAAPRSRFHHGAQ
ncbi:hypothetical protein F4680DRAFT_448522 [Xylaria scruposa]|nr:hypothetical protein F4680DRAFT_448522 [Xylaria scruposa]